jgi:hypothetical protein
MNWLLISLVLAIIYMYYNKYFEGYNQNDASDIKLANDILNYMSPRVAFIEYIDFLSEKDNKYRALPNYSTYKDLFDKSKTNSLKLDDIIKYMIE